MTWNVKYIQDLNLVECTAVGFLTADEISEATARTIALAIEKGTNLILVDDSKVEKTVDTFDIYKMPQLFDELNLDLSTKIAVILPVFSKPKEDVQFYETVCRNSGWNLAVFQQRQEAINWLVNDTTSYMPDTDDS
jgi:hypothetical protein